MTETLFQRIDRDVKLARAIRIANSLNGEGPAETAYAKGYISSQAQLIRDLYGLNPEDDETVEAMIMGTLAPIRHAYRPEHSDEDGTYPLYYELHLTPDGEPIDGTVVSLGKGLTLAEADAMVEAFNAAQPVRVH